MSRSEGKKERGKKEEVKYPCSPRSQKWIANLLPVLESYNYNYQEVIRLVKSCEYNADRIQLEVERIMQVKLGHEQGEWELVKPSRAEKNRNQRPQQPAQRSRQRPRDERRNRPRQDQRQETPEEDKKLLTSWASLLKRDSHNTHSTQPNSHSTNQGHSVNLGDSVKPSSNHTQLGELSKLSDPVNPGHGVKLDDQVNSMDKVKEVEKVVSVEKEKRPAVVMPKEFNFSDSKLSFGCLEEEWSKPWPDWQRREFPKAQRLQSEVFPNYYERKSMVYYDDKRLQVPPNPSNPLQVTNAAMPKENVGFGTAGVYFNYPYSTERLQNPPGLVSYYTPQPFYGFGNNNTNTTANSSNNNTNSMWQS